MVNQDDWRLFDLFSGPAGGSAADALIRQGCEVEVEVDTVYRGQDGRASERCGLDQAVRVGPNL